MQRDQHRVHMPLLHSVEQHKWYAGLVHVHYSRQIPLSPPIHIPIYTADAMLPSKHQPWSITAVIKLLFLTSLFQAAVAKIALELQHKEKKPVQQHCYFSPLLKQHLNTMFSAPLVAPCQNFCNRLIILFMQQTKTLIILTKCFIKLSLAFQR